MANEKIDKKNSTFDPNKTKELQKDWQGYGKANVYYGLVVMLFFVASILYHIFMK